MNNKKMTLPPGPQILPFLQMAQWVYRPLEFMEACDRKFGSAFTIQLSKNARPLVFFSDPEAIQQIFTASSKQFNSGRANQILKPLLGKHSLELIDGRKHARKRQLMMPPFHGEKMRHYGHLIRETTVAVASQWKVDCPFQARIQIKTLSFRLMCRTLLGYDQGDRFDQISGLFDTLFDVAVASPSHSLQLFLPSLRFNLGQWSPWGKFTHARTELDRLLSEEILIRRTAPDPECNDMLTMLMDAKDENGQAMDDEDVQSEIMTLLLAGHETIAIAITWALYWIHRSPEVLEKIRQEISPLGASPDPLAASKLPYLSAVCQETLRIYPVGLITFPRITKTPIEIGGYCLPKGTVLTGCIYLAHQRPDLYPDPKTFKPERFMERKFAPYEYFPFGGGNRLCLGGAFAPFAMKVVLAQILACWDLDLVDHRPIRPMRRGVTTSPKGDVPMVVRKLR